MLNCYKYVKNYQFEEGKYRVIYTDGTIDVVPKEQFEKSTEYRRFVLNKAKQEFVDSFIKSKLGILLENILDKLSRILIKIKH